MIHSVKKLEKSKIELTITVPANELQPFFEKAAIKLSQEIKISGFRPGKAPYNIVKQKVGEGAIMEKALDDIIAKTYIDSLQKEEIMAIGQPKIEVEKAAPGNDLIYKAIVPVLPQVTIGDYKSIKISPKKAEVKDEQVEKVIADIIRMRAKEKSVTREAKKDDRLEIDFDIFLDKVPIENGGHKKYPITIGEGRFIPGFEDQLIGLKAGDEKEFVLKFPEKYHAKNLAGKKCDFKVKCNNVFEVELPKLDDAFASELSNGQFKTVKELKDSVKSNLEQEEKAKQDQRLEVEMLEKIVDISKFSEDIPDVLLDHEVERMVHEMEHSISQQGIGLEDYLKSIKKTKEDLVKDFRPQAEKRVKTSIIAREIYAQQKIDVTDKEIDEEIEKIIKSYPASPEIKQQFESEQYREHLKNSIGNRKVIDYLKSVIVK